MKKFALQFAFAIASLFLCSNVTLAASDSIIVKRTADFELTADIESKQWKSAEWHVMAQRRDTTNRKETRFKTLYSDKGIYFLFDNEDAFLTASRTGDFDSLWLDDVNEVFLWPDTANTIYFEYEITPLDFELPILVPNLGGKFLGWRPWLYTNERKTRHLTTVIGGNKQNGSRVKGWISEFFIPYKLLTPLLNVPPVPGSIWRANMYRIDHDNNRSAAWSWQKTETNFHQFEKFGRLIFQ